MRIIVGFGNKLRGEDAFGVDTVFELEKLKLKDTKTISVFQLTPELSLKLKKAKKLIFIDAAFSTSNNYSLACSLEEQSENILSHHLSIETIIMILNELYNSKPEYEVFSMLTNNFNEIINNEEYTNSMKKVVEFIKSS